MKKKAENSNIPLQPSLNIANVSGSTLFNRKGKLIVSRQLILEAKESTLREIFTNFFPIDADRHHQYQYWDSIAYYGVSPHFEEVEEACVAPEYDIVLDTDEDGNAKFNRFDKRELYYR